MGLLCLQLDITSPEAYHELHAAEQKYFVDMVSPLACLFWTVCLVSLTSPCRVSGRFVQEERCDAGAVPVGLRR